METLVDRIARVQERIVAAARRAGRRPEEVRLIGISKTQPVERIAEAYDAGLRDFGESRVQEMEAKSAEFRVQSSELLATWHLIGHLQTNKAKKAAAIFDYVQTVDSVRLAAALAGGRESGVRGQAADLLTPDPRPPTPILIQVNVSGEASKEGFALADWQANALVFDTFCAEVEQILTVVELDVRGLMTIAPYGEDPLPTFHSARRLREALMQRFPELDLPELSMGMSDDFETAIAEGATMVRVGRAIFGER